MGRARESSEQAKVIRGKDQNSFAYDLPRRCDDRKNNVAYPCEPEHKFPASKLLIEAWRTLAVHPPTLPAGLTIILVPLRLYQFADPLHGQPILLGLAERQRAEVDSPATRTTIRATI